MCSYRRLRLKPSSECLFVFGNSTLLVWFSSVFHACGFSDGCRPHRASKCNKFSYQSQSALKPHPEHTRKQFLLIIIWLVLSFWRNCEPLMNARTPVPKKNEHSTKSLAAPGILPTDTCQQILCRVSNDNLKLFQQQQQKIIKHIT